MEIKVTGRGIEITLPLRNYAHAKITKLEEFFKNIQKVEVVLEARSIEDVEKRQVAEIRAWMAGLKMVQAIEAGRDMYAAIDLAVEEAKRQIQRHKQMHVQEQRRSGKKFKEELSSISQVEEEEAGPVLVMLNRFKRTPMSFDQAKEELNLSKQNFMMFENRDKNEINVVCEKNGDFELLNAEAEMLPEEAVEQLEKEKQNLIFFSNKTSNVPSVVFRRKSGNFGLIEPEV